MASPENTERRPDGGQASAAPSISLPKGGGAIRGVGEKFAANPVTGTGSMSVPIATSPGRSGFGPELSLSYDSGAGNGPFGFGWNLSLPAISRKTDKGLPQYRDTAESDVFILSGAEDLVPEFEKDTNGDWVLHDGKPVIHDKPRTVGDVAYRVRRYRPRIEGLFARIERWTNTATGETHWRSISKDNISTLYGKTNESRIYDPGDPDPAHPTRIFSWLICESYDDKGNVIVYGHQGEDSARIFEDAAGNRRSKAHERNRTDKSRSAQRYLTRIRYGNRVPYFPVLKEDTPWPEPQDGLAPNGSGSWYFEVVFDYGAHNANVPKSSAAGSWPARGDPFSSYRAGFEVRTYRLCRRVLMFHHFPGTEQDGVGDDCLVCSTDFTYSDEVDPTEVRNPVYAFLRKVTQTGYRRNNGGYDSRSLPSVEFGYTEPAVQETVEEVDPESLENLPIGLDGSAYRWTDLHGEGIPGILTEQAGAWFYKRNLSPIPRQLDDGSERVTARFAPLETVALKPSLALAGGAEFMDLAGDGVPDVVVLDSPTPGLHEHDGEEGWQPFRPFTSRLNRDMRDPNLRFVDLDGDGHADVLITEDEAFVWHPSLEEAGFGPARRVAQSFDEEKGPRIGFADGIQSIHLADLGGDGLTDIVRIRNGEACYWPNLGYGRFGAKVTMDHAPWFDHPDQFDPKRLRLADIDGSGTTDIIYLHRDGIRLYFNQSGNSWSEPQVLQVFPRVDDLAAITPIDLLGNGTACLVWSSPMSGDASRPMRYVNLMGNEKPHLLVKTTNDLGAETRVHYAPSTKFYLQDKRDGKPRITQLPFPVHVVERVETYDHISRNRFVTRYVYHHGYFDGEEREFRGFGMVEQWDTEQFAALADGTVPADNIASASHVPPVHTKTWFHTGVYLGRDHVSDYFAGLLTAVDRGEYFREPGLTEAEARALLLPDTVLPTGLSLDEEREACRALKGSMLRQEVYADDAELPGATPGQVRRAHTPYTVTEQNFSIRTLQPRGATRHAVFLTHAREAISYHYERNPADPRIQHALTVEVDGFGNVLKQTAIGYGRRVSPLSTQWDRDRQATPLLTYTENRVTNAIESADTQRNPLPCEAVTFELTGYMPTGAAGRYQASDFVEPNPAAPGCLRHKFTDQVAYEAPATGNPCRRPIEWQRTLYRRDDLSGLMPLGEVQPLSLPGESYKLAFTPGLLAQVFQRPRVGQPAEPLLPNPAAVLGGQAGNRGGYVQSQSLKADGRFPATDANDHWWIPSGRSFFTENSTDSPDVELAQARQHFFLPRRYRDPFGQDTFVDFDSNDLLMLETWDALGNRVTVNANDYRVLQPRLVSDPNRNQTEVAFDILGMVVGTAVMGKPLPAPVEGDTLSGFVADLTQVEIDDLFDSAGDPHANAPGLLKSATTRVVYDLDRFRRTQQAHPTDPTQWQPACAATLARETHASAPLPPQGLKIQLSFSYSDGFGREIQKKIQAEPGPVVEGGTVVNPRWVGSGWTIFNNKGKPVRQYEPFFSKRQRPDGTLFSDHRFEFGVTAGVSPVLFYDPAERVIATLHPNHAYEKVVFDSWRQTTYDVNDTCAARNAQTGDPRTDPDVGGYVAEYFKALPVDPTRPWQTWQAQRSAGALGSHEQAAAIRAAAHADTPTSVYVDAMGRPFLTVTRNRVVCAGHDLDGTEDSFATRVGLDIEGNQRDVRDERKLPVNHVPIGAVEQRIVMRYSYDMLGNRIQQLSMEAGARWMLDDAAGKPIRAWDDRGHIFTTSYDALRRPMEQTVRGATSDSDPRTLNRDVLVDKSEYGERQANAEPLNLRTRIFRHCDSAGVATNARLDAGANPIEAYDFKGNLLHNTRQLISDYKALPDWLLNPPLDDETFEDSTRYDALNRPVQSIAPHSSLARAKRNVIQPVFNEANLLERVHVWMERDSERDALLDPHAEAPSAVGVANIDYDAKGQRQRIDYKNGASTRYSYDPLTFRLTQLLTRRNAAAYPGDDPQPPVAGWPGRQVQNLHYTYDPAGNITHIHDDAQQTIYFKNKRVEPSNDYTYDALYRLIQATGREHLGQDGAPIAHSHNDVGRVGLVSADATGRFSPNDGNAMGTYIERYVYDAAGNFLQMQHRGSDPAHAGWTRRYTYGDTSLTEGGKQSNRLSSTQIGNGLTSAPEPYHHDAHGNMVRMPHLGGGLPGQNLHWDYKDQLHQTDLGGGGTAWYVYDASGQRVRKVWEKGPGLIEERIYLGGFEIFRKHNGPIDANTSTLERETLHVMDEKQRFALVETRTRDATGNDQAPRQLSRYQFGSHLGSASLELDDQARVITYEEYTPYGSTSYQAVRSRTETAKWYRYTGKERDEESGLSYHSARYYAPWLGRWLGVDPEALQSHRTEDGVRLPRIDLLESTYRYADANPTAFVDPSGREPVTKVFNKLVRRLATRGATKQVAKAARTEMKKVGTRVASKIGAEGIPSHTFEHIALHFTRDATEKATHTVFAKGLRESKSQLTDAIQKTLRQPSVAPHLSVTDTGQFAIVFERAFGRAVGDSGEQVLRVVVDHRAKLISAFPVKQAAETVTKSGVRVAAGRAVLPAVALAFAGASEARAAHEESERKINEKLSEGHWSDWILPDLLVSSPLADGTLAPMRRREAAFDAYAQAALRQVEESHQRTLGPGERESLRGVLELAWEGF
jgi:RHS repeat-associated protein